jgi:hypothetical protein
MEYKKLLLYLYSMFPFWRNSIIPIARHIWSRSASLSTLTKYLAIWSFFFVPKRKNTTWESRKVYRCVRLLTSFANATSGRVYRSLYHFWTLRFCALQIIQIYIGVYATAGMVIVVFLSAIQVYESFNN